MLGTAAAIVPYIAPEFAEADDFRQQALQAGNCPRRVDRAIVLYRDAGQYVEKAAHYGTTVHGCGCPDAEAQRARKCKHVLAAIMRRRARVDADDVDVDSSGAGSGAFELMRERARFETQARRSGARGRATHKRGRRMTTEMAVDVATSFPDVGDSLHRPGRSDSELPPCWDGKGLEAFRAGAAGSARVAMDNLGTRLS